MEQTKTCSKCEEEKLLTDFYKRGATCKDCHRVYLKEYYKKNRGKVLKWRKEHRRENIDKYLEKDREYYKKNRGAIKEYYRKNKASVLARSAKRRARKLRSTPDWLTPIDHLIISHLYVIRQDGEHVDHIVPLKGETVSGLHVPWNLQIIPAEENLSKGNRSWPNMWDETG